MRKPHQKRIGAVTACILTILQGQPTPLLAASSTRGYNTVKPILDSIYFTAHQLFIAEFKKYPLYSHNSYNTQQNIQKGYSIKKLSDIWVLPAIKKNSTQIRNMPKRLGSEPIYIAPGISGYIDNFGNPHVIDETTNAILNPHDAFDKIIIYERQVKGWFLNEADKLIRYKNQNKGFIVLMICLSYFEGVEEYKTGQSSHNHSRQFFRNSIERIYPGQFSEHQLDELYGEGRCGLFHNGMVRGQIIIRNTFPNSIEFDDQRIKISPKKLLRDIKIDFDNFITLLRQDLNTRNNFSSLYTNL